MGEYKNLSESILNNLKKSKLNEGAWIGKLESGSKLRELIREDNDSSNIKELEKYIKGSTLNDAAKFLGMYFHGDADSFEVQGSELVDKKHKDNRRACSMDGDKIASIASDLYKGKIN